MEHGDEFLSDWHDWESDEQPLVPNGPDTVFPDVPVFHGPDEAEAVFPEVPVFHGPDEIPDERLQPQAIAEPPADLRRSTHLTKPPDRYGITCKKK